MSAQNHEHASCLHEDIKFCRHCNVVFCNGCDITWHQWSWQCHSTQPLVSQPLWPRVQPWYGASITTNNTSLQRQAMRLECKHDG